MSTTDPLFIVSCDGGYRSHPMPYGQALAVVSAIEDELPVLCVHEHVIEQAPPSLAQLLLTPPPSHAGEGFDANTMPA